MSLPAVQHREVELGRFISGRVNNLGTVPFPSFLPDPRKHQSNLNTRDPAKLPNLALEATGSCKITSLSSVVALEELPFSRNLIHIDSSQ